MFAFLAFLPQIMLGQNTISGTVIDKSTHEPLPAATVYINGTTIGTATDSYGRFMLKNIPFPSTVVFSFVGYETETQSLTGNPGEILIELNANNELPQVDATGQERAIILQFFKEQFLGKDKWGENATIRNDDHLFFIAETNDKIDLTLYNDAKRDTVNIFGKAGINPADITFIKIGRRITSLKAWADEAIIIDLPLLGYQLYVDLVEFTYKETRNGDQCNTLGYFYYKPYNTNRESKIKEFEKNRKLAYYNSTRHFLRSLSQGRLKENGYKFLIAETENSDSLYTYFLYTPLNISRHFTAINDEEMLAHGLKNKRVKVLYCHQRDNSPVILKDDDDASKYQSESGIHFLKDSCTFLKEGVVTDNNIVFTGDMANKKVASCLPDDYQPQ